MIKFIKKLLIDLFFIAIYFTLYKLLGFEVTIVVAIGQICSHLVQNGRPNKVDAPAVHTIYSPQKNKVKF